ncbi:MAG: DUF802 domain-containing protein [Hahellaceae bacterium]|nr:DUF802 domain-containing protein [Hahellaceae bacterium]MCP5170148.1 DUF802 domain-containing protein [Hahellaceae bacterium]
MSRIIFATAFLLGAVAVAWMGSNFVDVSRLGLAVISVIGGVYGIGLIELCQFRRATTTLTRALGGLANRSADPVTSLEAWLQPLNPALRNPVRLRIEGERAGLPAPVLTPYLVGLLVMLGLLGTFVGMVDTLKGAVVALEGTTKLEAIRAGLAAPINGLSLAFGTSVAGVAASAMLGLMSTLSRRDRMLAVRQLDTLIPAHFRQFSLVHSRQETYKALQTQSQGLPEVAEKLQLLAQQMAQMTEQLGEKLVSNQGAFHATVQQNYRDLAVSVAQSLKDSIAQTSRLTGENLRPIVQEVMTGIQAEVKEHTRQTHQSLSQTVETQLQVLSARFGETSERVAHAWQTGLASHEQANRALLTGVNQAFSQFNEGFSQAAHSVVEAVDHTGNQWFERQAGAEQQRYQCWADTLEKTQIQTESRFSEAARAITEKLDQAALSQSTVLDQLTAQMREVTDTFTSQWQSSGEAQRVQQTQLSDSLTRLAQEVSLQLKTHASQTLQEMGNLLQSCESLVQTRIQTETDWLAGYGSRLEGLAEVVRTELNGLRDAEAERGTQAVNRLAELEASVSTHLAALGQSLEAPMIRLIQTASETPRAAAEVIEKLRSEISKNIERDNQLLEERTHSMQELQSLSAALQQASTGQLSAVEALVQSSSAMLETVGGNFTQHVAQEVSKISSVADQFASSAIEMSSLGEAFHQAMSLHSEANSKLMESLGQIERALEKSSARSDEQLGYYVAQARDVIDHSILSQKEIFEELRQLRQSGPVVDFDGRKVASEAAAEVL